MNNNDSKIKTKERNFDKYHIKIYGSKYNNSFTPIAKTNELKSPKLQSPNFISKILKSKLNSNYSKSYENSIFLDKKVNLDVNELQTRSNKEKIKKEYIKKISENSKFLIDSRPIEKRIGINLSTQSKNSSKNNFLNQGIEKEWVDEFFWKKIGGRNNLRSAKIVEKSEKKDKKIKIKNYFNEIFDDKINFLSNLKNEVHLLDEIVFKEKNEFLDDKEDFLKKSFKELNEKILKFQKSKEINTDLIEKEFINYFKFQTFIIKSLINENQKELALISLNSNKMLILAMESILQTSDNK